MWARIHLIPLLQAEEDRDLVRRHWADLAREKELLGAETSPYHGNRYVTFRCLDAEEPGGRTGERKAWRTRAWAGASALQHSGRLDCGRWT